MKNEEIKIKEFSWNGFTIFEVEEVASTNTLAGELMDRLKDQSVVLTYRQTQGRGQMGNCWESEPGKNISMTVVLKPERLAAERQFAVSMVIALGVYDYVSQHVEGCTVKWPNDVYVGEKKVAGILIEHTVMGGEVVISLCGVGLNVNQACFFSDAPNPVSMRQLLGREFVLKEVLSGLLEAIGKRYVQVLHFDKLKQDLLQVLYRRDGIYRWADEMGEFEAMIKDINEYGQLVLGKMEGEERIYSFKEVRYL